MKPAPPGRGNVQSLAFLDNCRVYEIWDPATLPSECFPAVYFVNLEVARAEIPGRSTVPIAAYTASWHNKLDLKVGNRSFTHDQKNTTAK